MTINADIEGKLYFDVKKIKSIKGIRYFTSLQQLCVWQDTVGGFSLSNTSLVDLELHSSNLAKYKFSRCHNLKHIRLSGEKISPKVNLHKFKELEKLEVYTMDEMKYEKLHIEECTKLKSLVLANYITAQTIDLGRLPQLETFDFTGTANKIDATGNHSIKKLLCRNCNLKEIQVNDCENLDQLEIGNTQVSTLDVSTNQSLTKLGIEGTEISTLDVTNNLQLQYLDCQKTKISELDLTKNLNFVHGEFDKDVNIIK